MSKGIEVSLKASGYRTEESYIALVLCRQRSMEDVRGPPADKTCRLLCPPECVAIGAELCPLWVTFALDWVLGSKLVPSLCCIEAELLSQS